MLPRFGGSIMAVRRNPGGRPSKFTTPAALAVVAELCRGGSLEAAARSAGVGLSTVYRWLALGRRGDPRFSPMVGAVAVLGRRENRSDGGKIPILPLVVLRIGFPLETEKKRKNGTRSSRNPGLLPPFVSRISFPC